VSFGTILKINNALYLYKIVLSKSEGRHSKEKTRVS
jgi:hypothetical protein